MNCDMHQLDLSLFIKSAEMAEKTIVWPNSNFDLWPVKPNSYLLAARAVSY